MEFEVEGTTQTRTHRNVVRRGSTQRLPAIHLCETPPATGFWTSHSQEWWNAATHGLGLVLSVAGSVLLMQSASRAPGGQTWLIAGCCVYVCTLMAVYCASTLSHLFDEPQLRRRFRMLDQGAIYLLIVGTFTPFALKYLTAGGWWLLLVAMWTIALAGFLSKVLLAHRVEAVSLSSYVLMGWLPIMAIKPITLLLPSGALALIVAGGLCYMVGTLFLALDQKVRHFHSVWHLLVIAGSACHYFAILH